MKFLAVFVLMISMLVCLTPTFGADVAGGKELYAKKCASCHGAAGEGKDAVAKMLKVELRDLGSKDVQSKSDTDLAKIIMDGKDKMKPVKDIDAKAAENIVAYLRTLTK